MYLRDKVLACLDGKEVYPVPTDLYLNMVYPGLRARLQAHYGVPADDHEALLQALNAHVRYGAPVYIGPPLETRADLGQAVFPAEQVTRNIWGTWEGVETYADVVQRPLRYAETISEIDHYAWPDPDWFDYGRLGWRYDPPDRVLPVRQWAEHYAGYARGVHAWMPVFSRIMDLCGMETAMVHAASRPDLIEAMVAHIGDFLEVYYSRLAESVAGFADIFGYSDDFAGQRGLLIHPDKWRAYFLPLWKRLFAIAHRYGMKTQMHSCGSVRSVLGDLVDAGLDILENVQVQAAGMDPVSLKREFGRDLTFYGGIDEQQLLPFGSPDEVRSEVRRMADILGQDGRFILTSCHFMMEDVPCENVVAMYEEASAYVPRGEHAGPELAHTHLLSDSH